MKVYTNGASPTAAPTATYCAPFSVSASGASTADSMYSVVTSRGTRTRNVAGSTQAVWSARTHVCAATRISFAQQFVAPPGRAPQSSPPQLPQPLPQQTSAARMPWAHSCEVSSASAPLPPLPPLPLTRMACACATSPKRHKRVSTSAGARPRSSSISPPASEPPVGLDGCRRSTGSA